MGKEIRRGEASEKKLGEDTQRKSTPATADNSYSQIATPYSTKTVHVWGTICFVVRSRFPEHVLNFFVPLQINKTCFLSQRTPPSCSRSNKIVQTCTDRILSLPSIRIISPVLDEPKNGLKAKVTASYIPAFTQSQTKV